MDKTNVRGPTLNIWQAKQTFAIGIKKDVQIKKNEFLFLIGSKNGFYEFKMENGQSVHIHKNIEKTGKVEKVF